MCSTVVPVRAHRDDPSERRRRREPGGFRAAHRHLPAELVGLPGGREAEALPWEPWRHRGKHHLLYNFVYYVNVFGEFRLHIFTATQTTSGIVAREIVTTVTGDGWNSLDIMVRNQY